MGEGKYAPYENESNIIHTSSWVSLAEFPDKSCVAKSLHTRPTYQVGLTNPLFSELHSIEYWFSMKY